jgi:diguanylate cyclase (GGDEF)-like protein/PAS domain S-box-containing protein
VGLLSDNSLFLGEPAAVVAATVTTERGTPHPPRPLRVLVVDDEPLCREVLVHLCHHLGAGTGTAGGGVEALEQLAQAEFDLALLDRSMGDMDGVELLKRIREGHSAADLPVVMVTSIDDSASVIEAFEWGANDYLTKPVDMGVAKARIETQMKLKTLQRQLAESEQRYALAVMGTNDGLWDWNLITSSVYYSPRWQGMLGLAEQEFWGTPEHWLSKIHTDDRRQVEGVLDAHLQGETEYFETELRMHHASGQYRWMLCRGQAVADNNGRLVRMAGALTDVTKGKVVDPLTGLPNRTFFLERLSRRVERYRRDPKSPFSVIYLDLDNFKQVNDTYGHAAGDQLLVSLARALEKTVRRSDSVISRLGGDEFAILVEEVESRAAAEVIAKRIANVVSAPLTLGGRYQTVASASIGVALPDLDLSSPDDLLRAADIAMYYAKGAGKAGYRVFDPAMQELMHRKLDMELVLRQGVDALRQRPAEAPFAILYEPICEVPSGRVVAVECHLKWLHPEQGPLGFEMFYPLAEEIGVASEISQWLWEEACTQMQQWRTTDPLMHGVRLHLGISQGDVAQPQLIHNIEYALSTSRLSPRDVTIELAEQGVMEDPTTGFMLLDKLRGLGVHVAIDDFGVGCSSITRLHTINLDFLKLGEPFTAAIASCNRQRTLMEAITTMAQGFGFDVVAEVIRDERQVEVLQQLGCHLAQGDYYSPPLAVGDVTRFVAMHG